MIRTFLKLYCKYILNVFNKFIFYLFLIFNIGKSKEILYLLFLYLY